LKKSCGLFRPENLAAVMGNKIVIGMGQDGGGWFEVFDDASAGYAHLGWPRVHWGAYNSANGETWPAVKK